MADGNSHLSETIKHLDAAMTGPALISCAQALHHLVHAVGYGSLDPALISDASQRLFAVAPRVAELAAGRITPEEIYFCLGYATAALTTTDAVRRPWVLAAVALLEADLRSVYLRDAISSGPQADLAFVIAKISHTAVFQDSPAIH
ncbi:hypothetical protein B5M44_20725 [Shinella sumterensis]|uniref:hypothetical protein n=1 Tax=Shinella sumterensis TaxID=1967501 RepID=UPI00106E8B98|nr:hypothetical protein [Shinella sumterensis]MCD1265523.1 hypothetical protein [Shinella sumterensis]TFE95794.1 hypothetical protein B5M44_20725 [Shinella sumterensis]